MKNRSQMAFVTDFVTKVYGHKTLGRKMDSRLNQLQIRAIFVTNRVVTLWDRICDHIMFETYLVMPFSVRNSNQVVTIFGITLFCDRFCDRVDTNYLRPKLWPRSFVTAFMTNFVGNYASLWLLLWLTLLRIVLLYDRICDRLWKKKE